MNLIPFTIRKVKVFPSFKPLFKGGFFVLELTRVFFFLTIVLIGRLLKLSSLLFAVNLFIRSFV